MLFWRAKAQKQAAAEAVPAEKTDSPAVPATESSAAQPQKPEDVKAADAKAGDAAAEASNVVTLPKVRLVDRLQDISVKGDEHGGNGSEKAEPQVLAPAEPGILPGQQRALEHLKTAMAESRGGFNVLLLGPSGTGRRTAALRAAEAKAKTLRPPQDWVYAAGADDPSSFEAFALPQGDGPKLVRDVRLAVAKSAAMLDRIVAGDDHRLSIDILEEEHRHRHEHALDQLRRRAEGQNIALVKTPEGFVLAPMHDGKVVRSDVFRALPEGLQREVEAKIVALESELTSLVAELPSHEIATDDKHAALARETALRAIKPNLAITRKVFNGSDTAAKILNLVEASFVTRAIARIRGQSPSSVDQAWIHALGGRSGDEAAAKSAPVILARDLSPEKLCGVIGHDASGRISIRPGDLMRANGGFLIVEAWRLVANPANWDALATALETGVITPQTAPGLAVAAEPIPLTIKIVLIADESDWKRLIGIDSGVSRYFPAVVRFNASAHDAEVGEDDFAAAAAASAKSQGLRPLDAEVKSELYRDAKRRAGAADSVSLDLVALSQILLEADRAAANEDAAHIRTSHIEHAALQFQQARATAP